MSNQRPSTAHLHIGVRVSVTGRIGIIGSRVPAGTCGVVEGIAVGGEVEVHFDNGRIELVDPDRLRVASCAIVSDVHPNRRPAHSGPAT